MINFYFLCSLLDFALAYDTINMIIEGGVMLWNMI